MAENKAKTKKIEPYVGEREFTYLKDTKAGNKKGDKVVLTYELYLIFKKQALV